MIVEYHFLIAAPWEPYLKVKKKYSVPVFSMLGTPWDLLGITQYRMPGWTAPLRWKYTFGLLLNVGSSVV